MTTGQQEIGGQLGAVHPGAAYVRPIARIHTDGTVAYAIQWFDPDMVSLAEGSSVEIQVGAVRAADLPPLAELVTEEDVRDAWEIMPERGMRAALEAYGARLLAWHGRTP